ncbi:hypothetical protein [Citricoccus sp.]|uniref:hypothetical protein n=1 Tax=Citricoccus sp. TaxID=1978372 RepID=UPI002C405F56|nr:hypothetical protein [Citricoccus sp.]HRO94694.1 hypothetical protein [Citricoccus sp.]
MDARPGAGAGGLTPGLRRGRVRALSTILGLAAAGTLLVACSVGSPQAATPTHPGDAATPATSVASGQATPAPEDDGSASAAGEEFTVSERRQDAIAVAQGSEHRVDAATLTPAEAGVTYVVHAACAGHGWMRYRLTVDDLEVSASRLRCGRDVVNTAFTAEGGERVQLHLEAPAGEGAGSLAEVVPAP